MVRSPCCDKAGLKKGPWTQEEDHKLLVYIEEHGYGNWRSLPEEAGLQRCGKSCRLRWTNYLRPDIKRGKFTLHEEQTIIQLHALLGNRWSAISNHLPKRTDNEIKNYWNTHLKKRLVKMGIDPVTHKHKNETVLSFMGQSKNAATLSHMAQWESARLEAEARLVKESKLLHLHHYQNNKQLDSPTSTVVTFSDENLPLMIKEQEHDWINHPTLKEIGEGLLLGDSSIVRSFSGGKNDVTVAASVAVVNENDYVDYNNCHVDNKNYWNSILNLVDSSPSDILI